MPPCARLFAAGKLPMNRALLLSTSRHRVGEGISIIPIPFGDGFSHSVCHTTDITATKKRQLACGFQALQVKFPIPYLEMLMISSYMYIYT